MLSSINSGSTTATLTVSTSATRDVVDFGNYPPRTTCITDVIVTEASGVKWIEMSIDGDPSHSSVGLFFTGDFNPDLDLFHPNLGPLAYPDLDLDEAPLNYKDFVLMSLGNGRLWGAKAPAATIVGSTRQQQHFGSKAVREKMISLDKLPTLSSWDEVCCR